MRARARAGENALMATVQVLKKKVEKLEQMLAPKPKEQLWILMWLGNPGGGLYGHGRIEVYSGETKPCSDEEELAIMRESWEARGHKCWGRKREEPVSFEEYLKHFDYLKRKPDKKNGKDGT